MAQENFVHLLLLLMPDAHSIGEIDNIHWGVEAAGKGGLTKDMTWNALPLQKIEAWLKMKRKIHQLN